MCIFAHGMHLTQQRHLIQRLFPSTELFLLLHILIITAAMLIYTTKTMPNIQRLLLSTVQDHVSVWMVCCALQRGAWVKGTRSLGKEGCGEQGTCVSITAADHIWLWMVAASFYYHEVGDSNEFGCGLWPSRGSRALVIEPFTVGSSEVKLHIKFSKFSVNYSSWFTDYVYLYEYPYSYPYAYLYAYPYA